MNEDGLNVSVSAIVRTVCRRNFVHQLVSPSPRNQPYVGHEINARRRERFFFTSFRAIFFFSFPSLFFRRNQMWLQERKMNRRRNLDSLEFRITVWNNEGSHDYPLIFSQTSLGNTVISLDNIPAFPLSTLWIANTLVDFCRRP